jgi:hypothetical protein
VNKKCAKFNTRFSTVFVKVRWILQKTSINIYLHLYLTHYKKEREDL